MGNTVGNVYVEILSACNCKCSYCYNIDEVLNGNNVIDTELFAKIVKDAKEIGVKKITVSGGEPMIHAKLCEMLRCANENGIKATVVSNFTLYNKDVYETLCRYSMPVQITLDGPTSEIHDFTRGKGTFDKTVGNMRCLLEMGYKGEIQSRMNLHMGNYRYMAETASFAAGIGASHITLAVTHATGAGATFSEQITDGGILQFISNEAERLKETTGMPHIEAEGVAPSMDCPYYGKENMKCGFRIAADGYIYPCQMFAGKEFALGNIKFNRLDEAANGVKMERFRELMRLRKHFIPECHSCAYREMCTTGCPAIAYSKNGNVFTNNGQCGRIKGVFSEAVSRIFATKENRAI